MSRLTRKQHSPPRRAALALCATTAFVWLSVVLPLRGLFSIENDATTSTRSAAAHLISYADAKFARTMVRLLREARAFGRFQSIRGYGPSDLDQDFKRKFKHLLEKERGGGYWIWKFGVISKRLAEILDGDFLVYLDAGSSVNPRGRERFEEYLAMLNTSDRGVISFEMDVNGFMERKWTTGHIFRHFQVLSNKSITESGQYYGGVLIMQKKPHLLRCLESAEEALSSDPLMITDVYNSGKNLPGFIENRHDQSVLSVVRKVCGSIVIRDESAMGPWLYKAPFWSTRKRKGTEIDISRRFWARVLYVAAKLRGATW